MATRITRSSTTGRNIAARSSSRRGRPGTAPPRFLIDNSVWARLSTDAPVVSALKSVVDLTRPDNVLVCPPIVVEAGFSTRTGSDHSLLMAQLAAFPPCAEHPTTDEAMLIQNRLWNGGLLRAVGTMDTLIAAFAIKNEATLLHYDRDFEHVAAVMPTFRHQWIVPRGSLP